MEEKAIAGQDLKELTLRANEGDQDAFAVLKRLSPGWTLERLQCFGMTNAVRSFITTRSYGKEGLFSQLCSKRESELLAASLLGPNPSPLERLLAEQVSLNWLALRAAEMNFEVATEMTFRDAYWRQSRVDAAHNRLMASIRTLAQVRKLQIPNLLQVNIGERQVNVAH